MLVFIQLTFEAFYQYYSELKIISYSINLKTLISGKPTAPLGPVTYDNVSDRFCDVHWQPPRSDGGSSLLGYIIEMRARTRSTWIKIGETDGKNFFAVNDLRDDNEYYFRIFAFNEEGSSPPLESVDPVKPHKKIGIL